MISDYFTPFHRQAKTPISVSLLISWAVFLVVVILGCSTPVDALEFRSVSGPPETGGSILRGGILVIGCTFNYPGDLETSSLFLVDTGGERTQVSFSSLDSSTSQAFSTVKVPQEIEGGHYFLVAVESNRSVIASSPNFSISNVTATSVSSSVSPSATSDPTSSQAAGSFSESGSNAGAIAGGVIGGVVGLALIVVAILLFLKKRKAEREREMVTPDTSEYSTQPTPLISEGPSTEARERYLRMREQKEQMLGMRERLERRLEDNMAEQRMKVVNPDGSSAASQSDQDTVPELRRQLDIMSQRIQVLEAELAEQAPPDYVSTI